MAATTYHANALNAETETANIVDQISDLKRQIQNKNANLYALQMRVLHRVHTETGTEDLEEFNVQCEHIEKEINFLVAKLKATRLVNTKRNNQRKAEIHAESIMRVLKENIARGDFKQLKVGRRAQEKKLQALEIKLGEARARGCGMEHVLSRLQTCQMELEQMACDPQLVKRHTLGDSQQSQTLSSTSVTSPDTPKPRRSKSPYERYTEPSPEVDLEKGLSKTWRDLHINAAPSCFSKPYHFALQLNPLGIV